MAQNRFESLNIDLILQNLVIEDKQILQQEDEFNYESPTINPARRNKYEFHNQESDYKISSKYQGNQNLKLNESYSSIEDQSNQMQYDEVNKENKCVQDSCTPPRKSNAKEFGYDEDNSDQKSQDNDNHLKRTPQNNFQVFSPYNEVNGNKFKITLEKFKLSATSSNKKLQEDLQLSKSNKKQHVLLTSNRKNICNQDIESPNQNSCYSNKNNNFSHTPKILNFLNSSATPQKNLITRTVNGKNQNLNSICAQGAKQNLFMSSQPCNFYQYSDQKINSNNQFSYSKKLFQDDTEDEEEVQQDSQKQVKQNLFSKFTISDFSDSKVKNSSNQIQLEKIDEFNSPQATSNNLLGSFNTMNNLFASPIVNSSKKKIPDLFATEQESHSLRNKVDSNNNQQVNKANNLFNTNNTIPKKGFNLSKDDQSTVKKNLFDDNTIENQFANLEQINAFFSSQQANSNSQPKLQQNIFEFKNGQLSSPSNINQDNNNDINKINNQTADLSKLNLPQVNEFSFETEEEDGNASNKNVYFQNQFMQNVKNLSQEGYDSDNFIRKNTQPKDFWDNDSQMEDSQQNIQNSFATDECFDQNNLQLIKGKSVNIISYENDLFNQNDQNSWNLGLNRRNSEVGLDSNSDHRNKIQIDIGENEFTRAMPGVKPHQRLRIGSLVQNKKRSQTVLFQIPENSSKKPKQVQPHQSNYFEVEDDFDVQTPIRSKMIEQQDFSMLYKKASSRFFSNALAEKDYIITNRINQNKENRFSRDFKILQVIKQTPSSQVYKCQSNVNGLIYAIKAIQIPQEYSEQERIFKEVQSLVQFSSYGFGILKFYNVWMEDSKLYLVTEHCLHNLRQIRNANSKPSEQLIRQIIRDICETLNFLHQNDCAHLGIKPENILVSKKMKFKLADLGLSKIQLSENNISQQESHFPYIAPELVGGCPTNKQNIRSIKADIFSLGAVLYELMTDQDLPKYGAEWENLRSGRFHKLMNSVKYSASLKNLIKSMLLRNPQLRPSCQDILNQIPPDNALELELKYMVEENNILQKKLEDLQKKSEQTNFQQNCILKKKGSF
ncbi:Serine/Threonine kinase domain protein (macronuclear) [Tetrahymena thermophila SB210]|uniref:Serine/Threonine kinase domain protein n=1 Tax=Tetrahymena thermophila (strain SB210) TaxID=312017 RepID=I7MMD3_TETTS|nr:Serine/Threonine kinase domain protein [Tetrahymena thermophila SB210]EAS04635.1 Serine/Threonine kinase domain protein [Tetrahymena thermophila SB210]|eukprot:XP_001024880.1 Serine/Threonine kinase domain protein [Tetrahymena thermophila SB210]